MRGGRAAGPRVLGRAGFALESRSVAEAGTPERMPAAFLHHAPHRARELGHPRGHLRVVSAARHHEPRRSPGGEGEVRRGGAARRGAIRRRQLRELPGRGRAYRSPGADAAPPLQPPFLASRRNPRHAFQRGVSRRSSAAWISAHRPPFEEAHHVWLASTCRPCGSVPRRHPRLRVLPDAARGLPVAQQHRHHPATGGCRLRAATRAHRGGGPGPGGQRLRRHHPRRLPALHQAGLRAATPRWGGASPRRPASPSPPASPARWKPSRQWGFTASWWPPPTRTS